MVYVGSDPKAAPIPCLLLAWFHPIPQNPMPLVFLPRTVCPYILSLSILSPPDHFLLSFTLYPWALFLKMIAKKSEKVTQEWM